MFLSSRKHQPQNCKTLKLVLNQPSHHAFDIFVTLAVQVQPSGANGTCLPPAIPHRLLNSGWVSGGQIEINSFLTSLIIDLLACFACLFTCLITCLLPYLPHCLIHYMVICLLTYSFTFLLTHLLTGSRISGLQ